MIVIIGAGIAGLTCAKYLKDKNIEATVLESADAVGGRVRTDEFENFKLDRGFQVFLTSYPEAKKILDYEKLNFKTIPSGARIRNGEDIFVMPNPLKDLFSAPQALFAPVGGFFDKFKVLQLNFDTSGMADPFDKKEISDASTIEFLKHYGFSDQMIGRFFVPFFRGVFLERELATKADFFKFLYGQFAEGDVVVPEKGMQEIPEQIAGNLSAGQIRLNTKVQKIEGKTIYLESGETIEAEKIVIATDANTSAKLLGEESKTDFNQTSCYYFTSEKNLNLEGEPYLIINSNKNELIDHIFPASNAVPSYSPEGKNLLSVNTVGKSEYKAEEIKAELEKWFGKDKNFEHLKTYKIPEALPEYSKKTDIGKNLKVSESLYLCGDHTMYPSLNGAMRSGRMVAEMISG